MAVDGKIHAGSFRDPSGHVYVFGGRILRTVSESARPTYEKIRKRRVVEQLQECGALVKSTEIEKAEWPDGLHESAYVLEHPRIPYISYPYEWCFEQLKAAALHHLDLQLTLLEDSIVLSDATAYNVQFIGPKPIFIDLLSLRPYVDGEFWVAHRQFCEQFLNPLLLRSLAGVAHNAWYRGALEGIPTSDLAKLIPFRRRLSLNVLTQVILQAKFEQDAVSRPTSAIDKVKSLKKLPKSSYIAMLHQLRRWIAGLEPAGQRKTIWGDYASDNSYASHEAEAKRALVAEFVSAVRPGTIIDLGCNTGNYAIAALDAGAQAAIGFDFDQNAVATAFQRSASLDKPFLPLWLDASNPSPDQGWRQNERQGFAERARADALIALAFEHHLAIAKNIPILQVVNWLIDIAPDGVIEFVPKSDSTVQRMLALREDIFPDYTLDAFTAAIQNRAQILKSTTISNSGRTMIWYAANLN